MDNKNTKKKDAILDEIRKLADSADKLTGKQLEMFANQNLGDEEIDSGFKSSLLNDTADPDKSYKLYYGIRRLLMEYLPKGKKNAELRKRIYEEKNIFLTKGHELDEAGIRHMDSRMAYIPDFLEVAFRLVADWVQNGSNSYDIFQSFYDLNEDRGYHKKKDPRQLSDFDKKLKQALNFDPKEK